MLPTPDLNEKNQIEKKNHNETNKQCCIFQNFLAAMNEKSTEMKTCSEITNIGIENAQKNHVVLLRSNLENQYSK